MEPVIRKPAANSEFLTPEGCWILESWNDHRDEGISIARARVEAGVTTRLHRLRGVTERYLVMEGRGVIRIGPLTQQELEPGDVAIIPAGISQQIRNDRQDQDLIFYCICTPRFTPECYEDLGEQLQNSR